MIQEMVTRFLRASFWGQVKAILLLLLLLWAGRWFLPSTLSFEDGAIRIRSTFTNDWRVVVHSAEGPTSTKIKVKKGDVVRVRASGRTQTSAAAQQDFWGMAWAYRHWAMLRECSNKSALCPEECKEYSKHLDDIDAQARRENCAKEVDRVCGRALDKSPPTCGDRGQTCLSCKRLYKPLSRYTFQEVVENAREAGELFHHPAVDADGECDQSYARTPDRWTDDKQYPHYEEDQGMYCPLAHGRLVVWVCEHDSSLACKPERKPANCANSGKEFEFTADKEGILWAVVNDSSKFSGNNIGLLVVEVSIKKPLYQSLIPTL